jgi:hypothetical protein
MASFLFQSSCHTKFLVNVAGKSIIKYPLDIFEKDEEEDTYYKYSEQFQEKGYELSFFEELLRENKFELIGIYEEMTTDAAKPDTQRAVFVARKKGTQ